MPAIWCMPLSFNPPLVGVAIAPEHETYRIIMDAGAFGTNWLAFSHARQKFQKFGAFTDSVCLRRNTRLPEQCSKVFKCLVTIAGHIGSGTTIHSNHWANFGANLVENGFLGQ